MKQIILQLISDKIISLDEVDAAQQSYDDYDTLAKYPVILKIQQLRLIDWALTLQIKKSRSKPKLVDVCNYSSNSYENANCMDMLYSKVLEVDIANVPTVLSSQVSYTKPNFPVKIRSEFNSILTDVDTQRHSFFESFNNNIKDHAEVQREKEQFMYKDAALELKDLQDKRLIIKAELLALLPKKYHEMIK